MQKLKVLIAGNVLDSVRLVEVVVTVPLAVLMPALIEAMQLPQTDLFGKEIGYALRFAKDGRAIAPTSTLAEAGVMLGARLILDSYVNEAVAIPPPAIQRQFEQFVSDAGQYAPGAEQMLPSSGQYASGAEQMLPSSGQYAPGAEQMLPSSGQYAPYMEPSSGGDVTVYSNIPLTGSKQFSEQFSDPQYMPDLQTRNASDWYGSSGWQGPGTIQRRKSGPSRRTLLVAAAAILGVGGLSYGAYRTFMNAGSAGQGAEKPPVPSQANKVTKVQNQNNPPKLPTTATVRFTFTKHRDNVRSVAWSPDGKLLASGADDKHAFVWGINGAAQLDIVHPGGVRALAWSPDGKRMVTAANNQIIFFNAQTGAILANAAQHTQVVTSVAWVARDQMQVVSGSADKRAIVWDTKTYRAQTVYAQHNTSVDVVSCSANGQTVASSSDDGFVWIWNVADGKNVHGYYQDVARPLRGMAFAPNGIQLAVGGDDGIVRIWSALICEKDGQRCMDEPQRLHVTQMPIRTVAWSPDGRLLAVGGNDGILSIWSPGQMQNQQALFSVKRNNIVRSLAWSPDGKQLACASGNNVDIMDLI